MGTTKPAAAAAGSEAFPHPWARAASRRALLFRAPNFPTIDAPPIEDSVLDAALAGMPVTRVSSVSELTSQLRAYDVAVLILSYGSAFPIDAWPQMQTFFQHGGGLVAFGGAPFHEPVRWDDSQTLWVRGPRQPVFAHDLLIGPAEPVDVSAASFKTTALSPAFASFPTSKTTWALTLRLTKDKEFPLEHGSAGARESVARPIVHVVDATGTPRGCPLIEIDRLRGDARGARLVFATTDAKLDAPIIRAAVLRAMEGGAELRAYPKRAAVADTTKKIEFRIERRAWDASTTTSTNQFHVVISEDASSSTTALVDLNNVALTLDPTPPNPSMDLQHDRGVVEGTLAIDIDPKRFKPGLHHVVITDAHAPNKRSVLTARTGFWIRDEKLLASGPKMSVSKDWLRKDNKPFPIVGTTYMASDVHRHFLFEPNPDAWDADFAAMKKRGINFVRTGLWTAWSRAMADATSSLSSSVDEGVLTALDAFVMSAAKHDIVVCFNFFAFLPPAYGGSNPYLDPRSIDGQKKLATTIASRFKNVSWIHWDLINEPSYSPLEKLWSTKPIRDATEATAWKKWVLERHGTLSESKLRALWRTPEPGDVLAVPRDGDFTQTPVQIDKRPRKARDFRELTEEIIASWAATMRSALKTAAGNDTLVTLGQDEGGIYERATQQLMAPSLDYTAVHTWWKNDDLLWDGVLTKVIGKPSLHQETGLMRLEDIDGKPWRTPDDAAMLLERKLGYAFAARGAGVVEWVWNVNPYMPIDEEATIGLLRPDGTAKPELDTLQRFAAFFSAQSQLVGLDDFEADRVVLIIPHARVFLGMTDLLDASKHVVRVLAERYGVVPAAVSDMRLTAKSLEGAKLVIVPAATVIDEGAAKALLEASKAGAKVLITGAIDGDSYGVETPSLQALGVLGPSRPVAVHEKSAWAGASGWIAFEGQRQESLRRREKVSLDPTRMRDRTTNVWHEPLPLELSRDREPLVKLLGAALNAANVQTFADDGGGGVAGRVLLAPRAALLVAINERSEPATRKLGVDGRVFEVKAPRLGVGMMLIDRATGKAIASLR